MIGRAAYVGLALSVITSTSALAAGPIGSVEVGEWKGGAYTNDTTNAFSHCAAGAPYRSGIFFLVSINVNAAWSMGFIHQSWQLAKGETIPITLTFDGRAPFQVFGNAFETTFVAVQMPNKSDLIRQFRKATTMSAYAKGQLYQFNLKNTSLLLPALAQCVETQKRGLTAAMHLRPQPGPKTPPAPPATPSVSSLRSDPPTGSQELQLEAVQLATNFILKTRLQNPSVLSRAETPAEFASFGAAWKSDEATGTVKIIPGGEGIKGIDVAAAVAVGDSKACKGKFASGRVSELVDDEIVFRGFASCDDSAGARTAQYFIVPRKRGGFVMFSVTANALSSANIAREEKLSDFRRAALTVGGQ
jgi:hypothetical protein